MESIDYMSVFDDYMKIAREHYDSYIEINERVEPLRISLNLEPTQRIELFELLSKSGREALIAVIFEALAVESYINYFAASKLGESYFSEHIEKLDVVSKFVVATELVTKRDFPKNNHIYGKLKTLVSLRNNLVHSKSIKFSYESGFDTIMSKLTKLRGSKGKPIYRIIDEDKIIGTCSELINLLEELCKSE